MKIALAQIESEIGELEANINRHIRWVHKAVEQGARLVVFPELSLTGYAPELAQSLAMKVDDHRLSVFQEISHQKKISIGLGLPIKTEGKPQIGMLIFEPGQSPVLNAKYYLHEDELPDFSAGPNYQGPIAGDKAIALAICYELSVPEHAEKACDNQASIYLASAAKTPDGVRKAGNRMAQISKEYQMTTLLCNCVGTCEGQTAGGHSSAWNQQGELIQQLDATEEALLIIDTEET